MLGPDFGGLRPWEMDGLTPDEERKLHEYRQSLERAELELARQQGEVI